MAPPEMGPADSPAEDDVQPRKKVRREDPATKTPVDADFLDISEEQDGSLQKRILVEGSSEEHPAVGTVALLHWTCTLREGGRLADTSGDRDKPARVQIGSEEELRAWNVGLPTMRRGEKAILRCAPHYAYGDEGLPPEIPGTAALDFEVELISWTTKAKEPEDMTAEERSAHAARCKDIGNSAFGKGDWLYAIFAYEEGIRYMAWMPGKEGVPLQGYDHGGQEGIDKDAALTVQLFGNCAAALLKAGEARQAAAQCTQALAFQKDNVKLIFRRGQAWLALGEYEKVFEDVAHVLQLEPKNKAAEQLRRSAEAGVRKDKGREKAMLAKMAKMLG